MKKVIALDQYKVSGCKSIAHLNFTPTFEWCVIKSRSKNGHIKDMCLTKMGLRVQNLLTVR